MKSGAKLEGIDKVLRNINKEFVRIKGRSLKGLIRAAAHVRRDMDHTPPLIPVDTGNLRASYYTNPHYVGKDPAITLGFTAFYAVFVHENLEAHFQRPEAGAKFMEAALKRNTNNILRIVAENARIP